MNCKNESQVIQRIIEEYERRLQEQLALARQDMANELEQQIQVRRVCVEETSLSLFWATNCNLRANLSLSLCMQHECDSPNFPCPRIIFVLCSTHQGIKSQAKIFDNLPKKKKQNRRSLNGRN